MKLSPPPNNCVQRMLQVPKASEVSRTHGGTSARTAGGRYSRAVQKAVQHQPEGGTAGLYLNSSNREVQEGGTAPAGGRYSRAVPQQQQ
ncbi:hypothetical protein AXG93_723s1080 [Marchantia polymorpha subsp. ruderalis]|uniref:Uncharacterized protein n=1 Tax=Marchantia polymorpha subsp. ruderalis TaxID=1480154 RepID=A0A176VEM9_MARPO|nr:hypothetical protein AXG93_723s1080 [Marchantia polymorpha subsp. ruderalis]